MAKISFWLQRIAQLLIVLLLVTFGVSLLLRLLPVDLATILLPVASEEERVALRAELGFDKGPIGYYLQWLGNFVQGDFGKIYFSGGTEEVSDHLKEAMPRSLLLMLYTQILALVIAVPLGVLSAYRSGRRADKIISNSLFALQSVPGFAIALILVIFLGVKFGWLPTLGYAPISDGIWEHSKHMIMPVISLSLGLIATYTRLLRADMITALREDYVTMAASKGLSDSRILWRHVLRPSSMTLMTSAALSMGGLIGGAIVIESIFATYGVGFEIFAAISGRQYIALQSSVAVIALFYVFFNLVVDIASGFVDPRTRDRRVNA
ncbi:MAG: ABC transporter permease [Ilumatobacteraceae bacterium]|nr:ABC transporter permease [Ilumatobacteraceae bacterium]MDP4980480.1 ABC transporter permease [Ilumatobacteraceae bacterium]